MRHSRAATSRLIRHGRIWLSNYVHSGPDMAVLMTRFVIGNAAETTLIRSIVNRLLEIPVHASFSDPHSGNVAIS
jgi:hypothetical protein